MHDGWAGRGFRLRPNDYLGLLRRSDLPIVSSLDWGR